MGNLMASITPLAGKRRQNLILPAHRMIDARKLTHRYYHKVPLQPDLFAEQNAINVWATVTVCYSGIEQAIKFLLGVQENFSSNDLHHRIGTLSQKLLREELEIVRKSYSIYQSLHNYIGPKTADDFLEEIDRGYPAWRYFLLEGGQLPTTHCGAMLEIWSALADVIEARVFRNNGLYHCARRFTTCLTKCVNKALQQYAVRETSGEVIEITEDLRRWVRPRSRLLNSWVHMLQHCAADANELDMLPRTKEILLASIELAKKCAQSDQDLAHFLNRAEKHDIVWSHLTQCFEVP